MDDRPILLAEGLDAVGGDHAARIAIVRPEADQPGIAHLGQRGIGAAKADRFAGLEDVIRDRVILRRPDRAEEGDNVRLRRELGEGEHGAGIGRLVVLGDEFDLFSQNAARFVHSIERDLGAGERVPANRGAGPVTGSTMPILRVSRGASNTGEHGRRKDSLRALHLRTVG